MKRKVKVKSLQEWRVERHLNPAQDKMILKMKIENREAVLRIANRHTGA